jgi:prepilin-type N-terminal cleavage/methylation domain-containing protein
MVQRSMQKKRGGEAGFTLVELLVVIVILAVLAAIVVFAVGGITDDSQTSACKADKQSLATAEEAYRAQHPNYVTEAALVPKYMHEASTLHDIVLTDGATPPVDLAPAATTGAGYRITSISPCT